MEHVSVTTKMGDQGTTMLFGGQKVSKSSMRLHAYGTVDELNSCLGLILAEDNIPKDLWSHAIRTQRVLFTVGADLATPMESDAKTKRITSEEVEEVENWIDELEEVLPVQKRFILPSGSPGSVRLHVARTVCRRAERSVVAVKDKTSLEILSYLNRLSDLLFVLARIVNAKEGGQETLA